MSDRNNQVEVFEPGDLVALCNYPYSHITANVGRIDGPVVSIKTHQNMHCVVVQQVRPNGAVILLFGEYFLYVHSTLIQKIM